MRFATVVGLAVALSVPVSTGECQKSSPALHVTRDASQHLVDLSRSRSDSMPKTRRLVLIGALIGGIAGAILYSRTSPDDGDFGAGLSIPVYVLGGVAVGTLAGYVVSVSIEGH